MQAVRGIVQVALVLPASRCTAGEGDVLVSKVHCQWSRRPLCEQAGRHGTLGGGRGPLGGLPHGAHARGLPALVRGRAAHARRAAAGRVACAGALPAGRRHARPL